MKIGSIDALKADRSNAAIHGEVLSWSESSSFLPLVPKVVDTGSALARQLSR